MEKQQNNWNWSLGTTTAIFLTIPILSYVFLSYLSASLFPYKSAYNATEEERGEASGVSLHDTTTNDNETVNNSNTNTSTINKSKLKLQQPSCPLSYMNTILLEILDDLYVNREMCRPEDVNNIKKHRIPKVASRTNKTAEPRGTMVIYIAVGLLLTSLGAAILEVYKAKGQSSTKKPALTRKCSLADLTVLKHNRKELMRRDTMWDIPEGRNTSTDQSGRKVSRPPLRLN